MARQSILAMAGEYQVTFSFAETEAVQPDYKLKKHRESDAYELVLLVEDVAGQQFEERAAEYARALSVQSGVACWHCEVGFRTVGNSSSVLVGSPVQEGVASADFGDVGDLCEHLAPLWLFPLTQFVCNRGATTRECPAGSAP